MCVFASVCVSVGVWCAHEFVCVSMNLCLIGVCMCVCVSACVNMDTRIMYYACGSNSYTEK